MVKKPTTTATKAKKIGRPKIDPADLRSVRFSFRMHPDLFEEIRRLARIAGQPLSVYVERGAIERVHKDVGKEILDSIGRYTPPSTKK